MDNANTDSPAPTQDANRFTEQFLQRVEAWDGKDKTQFVNFVQTELASQLKTEVAKQQLNQLTSNYLDGGISTQSFQAEVRQLIAGDRGTRLEQEQDLAKRVHDVLADLRQEFTRANATAAREKILDAADQTTTSMLAHSAGNSGASGLQMRRAIRDYVAGKVDITKVTETMANYRATVTNAVLTQRESVAQGMKI